MGIWIMDHQMNQLVYNYLNSVNEKIAKKFSKEMNLDGSNSSEEAESRAPFENLEELVRQYQELKEVEGVKIVKGVETEINKLDKVDEVIKIGKGAEVNLDEEEFDANIANRETNMKGNGGDFDDDFEAIIARENSFEIFGESEVR